MAFAGKLDQIELAVVFQNLSQMGASGALVLRFAEGDEAVQFRAGRIAAVAPEDAWELAMAGVLRRRGLLSAEDRRPALRGGKFWKDLEKRGLPESALREALRFIQEDLLFEIMARRGGEFEFQPGGRDERRFPKPFFDLDLSLDPQATLMEAARRADEVSGRELETGERAVLRALPPAPTEPDEACLAELLDGRRDIAAVIRESGLGRHRARQVLGKLLGLGRVAALRAEDHVQLGDQSREEDDAQASIFHYQRALELRRTDRRTREKLVEVLLGTGQQDEGQAQLKLLGESCRESGDSEGEVQAYEQLLARAPLDLDARERHYQALRRCGRLTDAQASGTELARRLIDLGIHERAQALLGELLREPEVELRALHELLAESRLARGDVEAAADGLFEGAEALLARELTTDAEALLSRALELAPGHRAAAALLEDLRAGHRARRQERGRELKRLAPFAAVLAVLALWINYDARARQDLRNIEVEVWDDLLRDDIETALWRLGEIREDWPWSLASREAFQQQQRLRALAARWSSARRAEPHR